MSLQAGIWNFDGKPVDTKLLDDFSQALKQQGPDGEFFHSDGSIALLYRPFHTTAESRREKQPHVSRRGFVITWDGRLDNREELATELRDEVTVDATDVALFGAAFDRWESECFRRIIGDWAVSVWNPRERELIFACDFMAIRHIFYYLKNDRIWWSTDLTPLVLLSGDKFHIDDEYIAGYFAHDPEAHLTPYREIRQVPPGQFVRARNNRCHIERYWRFNPESRTRYKSDAEYEKHFRYVFRQSVRRRLRSDSPVLAELSGGLDSSSIVCMADDILSKESTLTPCLGTLSYFDKTEPNGDDYAYFEKIEARRGRVGKHIDASKLGGIEGTTEQDRFASLPGHWTCARNLEAERAEVLRSGNYRAVLSGIGGDEFLGGIPTPYPQLADLILQLKPVDLVRQAVSWAIVKRRPFVHIVWGAAMELIPASVGQYVATESKLEPWINKKFAQSTKIAIRRLDVKEHFGLFLPTRRSLIAGVLLMANKMAKWERSDLACEEIRYPYLDRELLEFVLSIPATQLLRPGERRSLMRRALSGIVPVDILSRRTKQFAACTPIAAFDQIFIQLRESQEPPFCSLLGYVDHRALATELMAAQHGQSLHIARLLRTVSLESWLSDLLSRGKLNMFEDVIGKAGSVSIEPRASFHPSAFHHPS